MGYLHDQGRMYNSKGVFSIARAQKDKEDKNKAQMFDHI